MHIFHEKKHIQIAFITSAQDPASCMIYDALRSASETVSFIFEKTEEHFDGNVVYVCKNEFADTNQSISLSIKLYKTNTRPILLEHAQELIEADYFIFLSKHTAKSEKPAFCVHSCGNFGSADLGGTPGQLSVAEPLFQTHYLRTLASMIDEFNKTHGVSYEAVLECTHHGPHIKKPTTFIEIGSSEKEWTVPENATFLVQVLFATLDTYSDALMSLRSEQPLGVAIGGPHYTPHITKYLLEKEPDALIGHIMPKYQLENLSYESVLQMIQKTPGSNTLFLDWKGVSGYKDTIRDICARLEENVSGLSIKRI